MDAGAAQFELDGYLEYEEPIKARSNAGALWTALAWLLCVAIGLAMAQFVNLTVGMMFIGLISFVVFVIRPEIGLAAFGMILPFEAISAIIPGVATGSKAVGILMALAYICRMVLLPERREKMPVEFKFFIMLVAWALLPAVFTSKPLLLLLFWTSLLQYVVLVIIILRICQSRRELAWFCAGLTLGAFAAGVYIQIINPSGLVERRLTLGGTGERGMSVNTFARVESLGLLAAGFLWILLRKLHWRLLLVPMIGIIVLVIYNSGSRGTMVALIGGATVFVTFLRRGKYFQRFVVAVFVLLLSITTIWAGTRMGVLSRNAAARFESITQPGVAGRQRMPIWVVGMEMGVRNIAFGVGYNMFSYRFDEYDQYGVSGSARAPHNSFVGIFADLGLVGLILFVIPFVVLGIRGYRITSGATRGLVLGGGAFMILSSLSNDTYCAKNFFAMFGLLIAASAVEIRLETLPALEWDTSEWDTYG